MTITSSRQRVALFGPVVPYRGGIAQYTSHLKRSLEAIADVTMVSFKRQYPHWLYPGESDKEPDQHDQQEPGTLYILDPLSPLSWHRAVDAVIASGSRDAVLTWWTLFWALPFAYIAWRLRRHGVRTTFLCHNLFDHDAKLGKVWLAKRLLSAADRYIVHSREQATVLKALYPTKSVLQRHLPVFEHFPRVQTTEQPRGRLEVLFFGFIRPYKGLGVLLDAMVQLRDPRVFLTIAGETWHDQQDIEQAARQPGVNVESHLHYVDQETAARYFERADVVVLPYLSATGSAVVTLAYHYRKPVLASAVGGLQEAVVTGVTGWLVPPGSPDALAKALAGIDRASASRFRPGIDAFVLENNWEAMANSILTFLANEDPACETLPCR